MKMKANRIKMKEGKKDEANFNGNGVLFAICLLGKTFCMQMSNIMSRKVDMNFIIPLLNDKSLFSHAQRPRLNIKMVH